MYICICHGISKTEISRLMSQGALTLDALQQQCRAGTNCGSCLTKLKALLSKGKEAGKEPQASQGREGAIKKSS